MRQWRIFLYKKCGVYNMPVHICMLFLCLKGGGNYGKINVSKEVKGFRMKKLMNKFNFALIGIMASAPAFAATDGLCQLITQMYDVFKTLRTLAFVGAAFVIAGWAWGYISSGKVELKDLQGKGVGMLVGFVLLFGIGVVLSFFLSESTLQSIGCQQQILDW